MGLRLNTIVGKNGILIIGMINMINALKNILPKGRYNAATIDGVEIRFYLTLLKWQWSSVNRDHDILTIHFACSKLQLNWHYVLEDRHQ